MGITIKCKKTGSGCDLTYVGFERFRGKVAYLLNEEFGKHYEKLFSSEMMCVHDSEEREKMFENFNRETDRLMTKHKLSKRIVRFLYESDCEGKCSPTACKAIYDVIKGYDDKICYGYAGRPNCARFSTLKALFLECAEMKSYLEWN